MKRLVYLLLGLFLHLSASVATAAAPATETAGQILARLNKMTPEQRQKTLVEKAKAEGGLHFIARSKPNKLIRLPKLFANAIPLLR